jgi:hypothetical protein
VSGTGDGNGDGVDDLIIGAYTADPRRRNHAGASYVVLDGLKPALARLIGRVEHANLSGGIENSLTSKLDSAIGLVGRGNTTGATGKVGAFIDQVEASRGKQIDDTDADAWIAAAETILDMLTS